MLIGDRIAFRRKQLGLTQDELATRMGYKSKAAISKIETNVNNVTQSTVVKFAEVLDTTIAYLMGWDEDGVISDSNAIKVALAKFMTKDPEMPSSKRLEFLFDLLNYDPMTLSYNLEIDQTTLYSWLDGKLLPPPPIVDKILGVFHMKPRDLLNRSELSQYEEETTDYSVSFHNDLLPIPDTYKVPRLGRIACGEPILAEEAIEDYDNVPSYIKCDFSLICRGDSMINARIFDGDIVCIKQTKEVKNGDIAAVMVEEDTATLKRVRLFPDHIILEPENPTYQAKVFWGEEMNKVRILGKATHFISTVR